MLEGKVALISGGSGGIGISITKELHACGCKVILGGTNAAKLEKCKEKFSDGGVESVIFNLSNTDSIVPTIKEAEGKFGAIDIFVNSAGVHSENANFWTMTPAEYDRIMDINLKGVYFACIEMAKYWKGNHRKGHILLISSSRGSEPAWSPYGISKWGINGMTKGLAEILTPEGIIVNAIAPGSTATPLLGIHEGDSIYSEDNKLGRMIVPDEIATYAKLLVSDAGDMLAGETIHISGGRGVWDIR
jgi:NAD(P)-dependent dehydrogenase (short-subunit alcohol dehydrogenase family)